MNIIDHSSDSIRQIVPQDLSFLSDADQQLAQALQMVVRALCGLDASQQPVALDGCVDSRLANPMGSHPTLTGGTLLYQGRLYELEACAVPSPTLSVVQDGVQTGSEPYLRLWDETADPSPVYGIDYTLSEQPHRRLRAELTSRRWRQPENQPDQRTWTDDPSGILIAYDAATIGHLAS